MPDILLVEDNDMNRDMLSRRLRRRGFDVAVAVSGTEGFECARQQEPDLILMDLTLPEVDGWESTRLIRENVVTRNIPVVALTAHALVSVRERALASGFDDFATKPVNINKLVEIMNRLLGVSSESTSCVRPKDIS